MGPNRDPRLEPTLPRRPRNPRRQNVNYRARASKAPRDTQGPDASTMQRRIERIWRYDKNPQRIRSFRFQSANRFNRPEARCCHPSDTNLARISEQCVETRHAADVDIII